LFRDIRAKYSKLIQTSTPMSTSRWFFPEFGRQIAWDLQKQHCDVIHIQHCSQYVPVIRALNPAAKTVLHLQAEWFSQSNPSILEHRLRDVDLLTTASDYVTEKTRRDFPMIADRCETTYDGIDASEFSREKDYLAGGQHKTKQILYVGAISPHKGLHVLLDAFKIVVKRYPDVHLMLLGPYGDYPLEETFDMRDRALLKRVAPLYAKNRISRLKAKLSLAPSDAGTYVSYLKTKLSPDIAGKVAFCGFRPRSDLVDTYYDADIFVFPPIWNEGFGIPPVEAMAAGVPVVASRSGAVVETVKDQQTGFLVPKNDAEGLAQAVLKLLQSDALRETMGRAGRQRVFEYFTWDKVAASMYVRYRNLCEFGSTKGPEEPAYPRALRASQDNAEAQQ
jgi:glycosyltransferase involved in cell wall biosynthesis